MGCGSQLHWKSRPCWEIYSRSLPNQLRNSRQPDLESWQVGEAGVRWEGRSRSSYSPSSNRGCPKDQGNSVVKTQWDRA